LPYLWIVKIKKKRKKHSETCLELIENKLSCFGKPKNKNELIPYHFRSEERQIEVIQESKKQNENKSIIPPFYNECKKNQTLQFL